jgi:hypothetical protein
MKEGIQKKFSSTQLYSQTCSSIFSRSIEYEFCLELHNLLTCIKNSKIHEIILYIVTMSYATIPTLRMYKYLHHMWDIIVFSNIPSLMQVISYKQ